MKWTARAAALASAGWFIGAYLWVAVARMTYPYELEWMEGGSLEQVGRILAGRPLYVKPSLEFIPHIYTPAYFYAAAAASWMAGGGFTPLRLVSVLASICSFSLIFLLVRHQTRSIGSGLLAAGLFAATFRLGGAWFDLGRVDSLFLALLLGGVVVLKLRQDVSGSVAAAGLFFLSFMTKQPALLVAFAMAFGCIPLARGRQRFVFPLVFAALAGATVMGMQAATGGWFWYYVFTLPWEHEIERTWLLAFWSYDLIRPLAIAVLLTGVGLYRLGSARSSAFAFYLALFLGLTLVAWLSRLHSGGYDNVLMPLHCALAIGAGLGVASMRGTRFESAALIACLAQFALLAYNPGGQIPTPADRAAGDRIVAAIGKLPGDVFIPMHGYLAVRAGKPWFSGGMAFDDVQRGHASAVFRDLEAEVGDRLRSRRFGAVILDSPDWGFQTELAAGYTHEGQLFDDDRVFMPRTGMPTRPQQLYLARSGR